MGAPNGVLPVWHETVYEWVEDYYHLDDKALEEKKAKEEAERKKQQEEAAKKAKEKKKNKKKEKPEVNVTVNVSLDQHKEKPVSQKKTNEIEGQMDIFSLGL